MNKKIRPSESISKRIQSVIEDSSDTIMRDFFKMAVEKVIQESLEQEVSDYLGCDWYERNRCESSQSGYRNGYYDRQLLSSEGKLDIKITRVRNTDMPYESDILRRLSYLE